MSLLSTKQLDNLLHGGPVITENVTVKSGQGVLRRGTVLGRKRYSCPTTGTLAGTGNGTMTNVLPGKNIKTGSYVTTCVVAPVALTHNGIFEVVDPTGAKIGSVVLPIAAGSAMNFDSDQINFTITDGGTDFDATSVFTVAVASGTPATGTVTGTGNGTCTLVKGKRNLRAGAFVATCVEAITHSGKFAVVNPAGVTIGYVYANKFTGTGNGTITEIVCGKNKKPGRYAVKCSSTATHGGTFTVKDPDGTLIGTAVLPGTSTGTVRFISDEISFLLTDAGTDFVLNDEFKIDILDSDEIKFIITDGSTDFIVGDYITITVTVGARDCVKVNSDNTDGSQDPFAITLDDSIDATSADVEGASLISGEVNERALLFGGNDTIETHRESLRDIGITTCLSVRE